MATGSDMRFSYLALATLFITYLAKYCQTRLWLEIEAISSEFVSKFLVPSDGLSIHGYHNVSAISNSFSCSSEVHYNQFRL